MVASTVAIEVRNVAHRFNRTWIALLPEDGYLTIPDRPGFGVTPEPSVVFG